MKPKLCIAGGPLIMRIAKEIASELSDMADFLFVPAHLEEALPQLREVEGVADIVLAGPSTSRMCLQHLTMPVISFSPTFPDVIRAIQEAVELSDRIAICLSRDDHNFDLLLLSQVMNVSLFPFYCDTIEEYENACKFSKEQGYKVIIGGSFTVSAAEKTDIRGILLYKGKDMIRKAAEKALEICQIQQEGIRRLSQLTAVVNNFSDGLLLVDEKGRVILDNLPAQKRLKSKELRGKRISELFHSKVAKQALRKGDKILNAIENNSLVVNYMPVRSSEAIHGLVCTFKQVDEVQDAEFIIRKRLHDRGFVAKYVLDDIIGESETIRQCKERAALFAGAPDPILITGESGTGKELFAHAIHSLRKRRRGPFVAINCATLPNELLESELFGYEKGAFTGAHTAGKRGLIELAHNGTLFLDEIATLSYPLQAKLLRLISEHEILKIGSDRIIPINVSILAATNVDIEMFVKERHFREDLYYRLSVFRLHIPPLRERPEDLFPLFLHFVSGIRPEINNLIVANRQTVNKVLIKQVLKGNARELENVAKRFCLLYRSGKDGRKIGVILEICLEMEPHPRPGSKTLDDLKTTLQFTEKQIIQNLLRKHKNKSDVASALNIAPSTLWRKLKKYGIQA